MSTYIAINGRTIIFAGNDSNPASSTCGMDTVRGSRSMTPAEQETDRKFLDRLKAAAVNPVGGESYGEAVSARDAWISSLPRHAAA